MSYEISVLWYLPSQNYPFPWTLFIGPSHPSTPTTIRTRGTKYSCYINPQTSEWEYSRTRNYIPYRDRSLGGKVVLGEIDDLSAFQEVIKDAPLPVGDENSQSWVCWAVQEAIEIDLLEVEVMGRLGRVPESWRTLDVRNSD
jgi:hypothetical protein